MKTPQNIWVRIGVVAFVVFCLASFVFYSADSPGFKTDISINFPANFWPKIKGVGENSCTDLSGRYKVTTYPENEITEYMGKWIVGFPPGASTQDGYEFTVAQQGCEQIEITYTNRFDQQRQYVVNKEENQLHWNPEQGLFCYKVTESEPDGFAGSEIFNENRACLGLGMDDSLLTDFQMHHASRLAFIKMSLVGNQKYKFKRIGSAKD